MAEPAAVEAQRGQALSEQRRKARGMHMPCKEQGERGRSAHTHASVHAAHVAGRWAVAHARTCSRTGGASAGMQGPCCVLWCLTEWPACAALPTEMRRGAFL
jgi:hypothetical protein